MVTAITRRVGPGIVDCALTYMDRDNIDYDTACRQHAGYERRLQEFGVDLISLHPTVDMPDSVFVEDTAVVVDEVAVITQPRLASRRPETESIAGLLEAFRPTLRITGEATIEGGDVIRVGRTIFVGHSTRTNEEGIRQLGDLLAPYDYTVIPVEVTGCLHLKTGASWLGGEAMLASTSWVDTTKFAGMEVVPVPEDEGFAANVLRMDETIIIPSGFPKTTSLLEMRGLQVQPLDFSELQKAEAGLTCCSIVFSSEW